MAEQGRKAVTCWLDQSEHAAIVSAAQGVGLKVATFVRCVAAVAASGAFPEVFLAVRRVQDPSAGFVRPKKGR